MKFNGYIFTNKEFVSRLVQNFRNKSELFFGIACLSFFSEKYDTFGRGNLRLIRLR